MSLVEPINGLNGLGELAQSTMERRTIPFDYAFRYELEGRKDRVHNSTVSVSIEATFTAVSIGYGVVPKVTPIKFPIAPKAVLAPPPPPPIPIPPPPAVLAALPPVTPAAAAVSLSPLAAFRQVLAALAEALDEVPETKGGKIGPRTAAVLRTGFRLNPEFAERILLTGGGGTLDLGTLTEFFQAVAAPPDEILFKYAVFDDGSGREFQSEPILNIAGLGTANGTRPFRYFARPIEFEPRTNIRLQVTEVSEFEGDLHVSLQGYKTLGAPGTPTGSYQRRARMRRIRR